MISSISRFRFSTAAVLFTAMVLTSCGGGGDSAPSAPVVTAPAASVFAGGNPNFVSPTGYLDGPGNVATFRNAYGLAVALDGSLLVADNGNQRIRRIDASGNVSTVGTVSYQSIDLLGPLAVAVSKTGKVYARNAVYKLADSPSPVVRLEADGSQTVVGMAERGFGLAVDAADNVFVITNQFGLYVFAPDGSKRVFDIRGSVFSDRSGTVYVSTPEGFGTIDASGKIAYLIRPLPSELYSIDQVAHDDNGNFYFLSNDGVSKVSPSGSVTKLLAIPDPRIRAVNLVNGMVWNAGALYVTVLDGTSTVVKVAPVVN
jgi:sugar lactone lactonase YvrE